MSQIERRRRYFQRGSLPPGDPRKWPSKLIVRACHGGQELHVTHGSEGSTYTLQPAGVVVAPQEARAAICSGNLAPMRDGLLEECSQSWGPVR
jgi:hypothetical protein